MATKTRVIQDESHEVPVDVLATDIQKIASAVEILSSSRLKWSTVVYLIARSAGVGLKDTGAVLMAAKNLAKEYLKPEAEGKSRS